MNGRTTMNLEAGPMLDELRRRSNKSGLPIHSIATILICEGLGLLPVGPTCRPKRTKPAFKRGGGAGRNRRMEIGA